MVKVGDAHFAAMMDALSATVDNHLSNLKIETYIIAVTNTNFEDGGFLMSDSMRPWSKKWTEGIGKTGLLIDGDYMPKWRKADFVSAGNELTDMLKAWVGPSPIWLMDVRERLDRDSAKCGLFTNVVSLKEIRNMLHKINTTELRETMHPPENYINQPRIIH